MDKNTSSNSKSAKYKLFYKGKTKEVDADSSYEAQEIGKKLFNTKKGWEISVVLLQVGDRVVEHSPDF